MPGPIRAGLPDVPVMRDPRSEWRHRAARAALPTVIALYVPFVLLLVTVLAGGAAWLTYFVFTGQIEFLGRVSALRFYLCLLVVCFDISTLLVCILLLIGLGPLFAKREAADAPPSDEVIAPLRHPRFHALVERICRRMAVEPPDVCALTPGDGAGIGDLLVRDESGEVRTQRCLLIGAALLMHLRVDEFAAVICHEIAHAAAGDTREGRMADRFADAMLVGAYLQTEDWKDDEGGSRESPWMARLAHYLLFGYFALFTWLRSIEHRYREYRADRVAAEICGAGTTRRALIGTHLSAYVPELTVESALFDFAQNTRDMHNLYAEVRRRWAELPEPRRIAAENALFMEPTRWHYAHPSLADRIRNLQDVSAADLVNDRPATTLFRDWEAVEQRMTRNLLGMARPLIEAHYQKMARELRGGR
ncbi:MAG: M48 family metallopeptidase [Phycisphaerales bacterium]|nr:M48 family metallopeptidase [Phycisphaerales bacterium]